MIGSHLVDELAFRGCRKIHVYDDLSRGTIENIKTHLTNGIAILNPVDLEIATPIFPQGTDIVFHLAAKVTSISYNMAHSEEMFQRNVAINWHVGEAVRQCRPSLYQYTSTACVYGHNVPVPTPESYGDICDPEPTNWGYGCAKFAGEVHAKLLYKEHGIPCFSTRFFNAISPTRDYYDVQTSHVVPALIKRICDGEDPVVVWGTGTQSRALVDARDIARAICDLAENPVAHDGQAVNIGHAAEITIGELARLLCDLAGRPDVPIVFDTSKPDGYPRRAADTTRLRELIGWVPSTPLVDTLAEMVKTYREKYQ